MSGDFIDTNVLIYSLSADQAKATRAEAVIRTGGTISVQVLNELANVMRCKLLMPWPDIAAFLSTVRALLTVVPVDLDVHETAIGVARRYGLSLYDSMILAAAIVSACSTIWSEDMQHGMIIHDRLQIINPFRAGLEFP